MKRALLSLHDKTRSCELASFLTHRGYSLISSGGTYQHLTKNGVENIKKVDDITEFPEILGGRVKTLHPKIFGGLLSDVYNNEHSQDMSNHGISKINILIANLYPFQDTVRKTNIINTIIENIDIGGHALIRAAAKNYRDTIVLHSPEQYDMFMNDFQRITESTDRRRELAMQAFNYVAEYDMAVSNYFNDFTGHKKTYHSFTESHKLKYGSNPQQKTASIVTVGEHKFSQLPFDVLNGDVGYINTLDAINSWQLVKELSETTGRHCAASFKHTNPAGVSIERTLTPLEREVNFVTDNDMKTLSKTAQAYILARGVDPKSSFGDFVAISGHVDISLANRLRSEVSDGIIAQSFSNAALDVLKQKKNGKYVILQGRPIPSSYKETRTFGNFGLVQDNNDEKTTETLILKANHSAAKPCSFNTQDLLDMQIANIVVKYAQSNAVSLVKNGTLLGVGVGQQSRIDCVGLACGKALVNSVRSNPIIKKVLDSFKKGISRQDKINAIIRYIENDFTKREHDEWLNNFVEAVAPLSLEERNTIRASMSNVTMASDGFLPFSDNIDLANKYGVKNIIQPGGSVNDIVVRERCEEYNINMLETGIRNFYH